MINSKVKFRNIVFLFIIASIFQSYIYSNVRSLKDDGIIKGTVLDYETKNVIEGAVIKILNTDYAIASDSKGGFIFENLDYGTYQLEISMIGYKSKIQPDIVITSGKPLEIIIEMVSTDISTGDIDVEASYFQKTSDENTSVTDFDYEEIRRAPGATEDVSRMLQSAPGVSITSDQRNDLIVRGGSPFENLILIDGIEVPNISHFGTQATTGGAIGIINLKLLRDVKIFTGGFQSKYGDRLSGVVDIKFREGSKERLYNELNFSMAGFGGIFEGPITKKSSYLVSVRRSYFDLLKHVFHIPTVPSYWDFNLKLNYDISQNDKLSVVGISSLDKLEYRYADANSLSDQPGNVDNDNKLITAGAVYTKIMKKGYLQAIVSDSYSKYFVDMYNADYTKHEFKNTSDENETMLKLELNYRLSKILYVNIGTGVKHGFYKSNIFSGADTTPQGYFIPEILFDNKISTNKFYANISLSWKFFNDKLIVNAGGRYDYFNYIRLKSTFSPRVALTCNITSKTAVNLSYGIFHQTPAAIWLASDERNKNLSSIRCDHYIAGVEHYLTPEIKGSIEAYEKRYKDYPVSVDEPTFILIDGGSGPSSRPSFIGEAVSAGTGYVRGIDISLQKKLSGNGIYGMVNYSYTKSGFTALIGGEKPAAFDPTHQFTIIAGYQVSDDWLIGFKFKYSGGRPYTPFDAEKSVQSGRGVYDMNRFNELRLPPYHRLDVRVDKKFYLSSKVSLTSYLELQNLYNRQNIYEYFWHNVMNTIGTEYDWQFMPVLGVNLQF